MGVYRLWRDGGFAVGALLAGVVADLLDVRAAVWTVAALTAGSGVVVAVRMYETHDRMPHHRPGMRSIPRVTAPIPYLHLPGTAREALSFYGEVFGCGVQLHTFSEFERTDGPDDAIAHGILVDGPVSLFAADVFGDEQPFRCDGMMLALLGAADASTLRSWFARLSDGGRVVDDLQRRPWGASDGQVIDRFGLHWLVGFEGDDAA